MPQNRQSQAYMQQVFTKRQRYQPANLSPPRESLKDGPHVPANDGIVIPKPKETAVQKLMQRHESNTRTKIALSLNNEGILQDDPWHAYHRQGQLMQAEQIISICSHKARPERLVMMLERVNQLGRQEVGYMKRCKAHNVITLVESYEHGDKIYIGLEYCPTTLTEIMQTHKALEQNHIAFIAQALFKALKHISSQGLSHNNVCSDTVRFSSVDGRPVLCEFMRCSEKTEAPDDLQSLGILLLECMDEDRRNAPTEIGDRLRQTKTEYSKIFGAQGHIREKFPRLCESVGYLTSSEDTLDEKFRNPVRVPSQELYYKYLIII
ncbi:MAG: hypothetical protein M1828_001045 [Chrysothrix sp. TS-e1954]|nr:MAG: hypothetical protein M1828_001045 [Chrysothrix sp. TS-e1954]